MKGGMMLKEYHGPTVDIELPTLEELVAVGKADPELLRMEYKRTWDRLPDVMARFDPQSSPPVQAAPYPGSLTYPLGPATISGTTFSIDLALANPTRVLLPQIMDLTIQRFFVDRVFRSAGGVTGGAVVYDIMHSADLYADRDIQRVEPGHHLQSSGTGGCAGREVGRQVLLHG
jgi:hypothetical protein